MGGMVAPQHLVATFVGAVLCGLAVTAHSSDFSSRHLLFSADPAQAPNAEISLLEIGSSGLIFQIGDPEVRLITTHLERSHLTIESEAGKVFVSAQMRDSSGRAATLFRNDWSAPSSSWDRIFTDDALEVRNPDRRVMLRLRVMGDRIQIEGEWWDQDGNGLRLGVDRQNGSAFITRLSRQQNPDEPMITPMFPG
jgi:hypothetical protein